MYLEKEYYVYNVFVVSLFQSDEQKQWTSQRLGQLKRRRLAVDKNKNFVSQNQNSAQSNPVPAMSPGKGLDQGATLGMLTNRFIILYI